MKLMPRMIWILVHPSRVYTMVREEKPRRAWGYYLLVVLIGCIPLLVAGIVVYNYFLAGFMENSRIPAVGAVGIAALGLALYLVTIPGLLVDSLLATLVLRILGARVRFNDSIRVLAYAYTPLILTIWALPLALGTTLWSAILAIRGYRQMYGVPWWKVLIMMVFWMLVLIIFGWVLRLFFPQP